VIIVIGQSSLFASAFDFRAPEAQGSSFEMHGGFAPDHYFLRKAEWSFLLAFRQALFRAGTTSVALGPQRWRWRNLESARRGNSFRFRRSIGGGALAAAIPATVKDATLRRSVAVATYLERRKGIHRRKDAQER
jgi:hypothetical protein